MVFGTTYRSVLTAFLSIPLAIVLKEVLTVVVPMYQTDHWLSDALIGVGENALAFALIGALMMVIAASVTQSEVSHGQSRIRR